MEQQRTRQTGERTHYRVQTARRGAAGGKKTSPRERRHLWQLAISGVILALAVAIKLLSPGLMHTISDRLTPLMGSDTNFTEAFAAVGKAVSGEGEVAQALNDAYVAVFGSGGGAETEKTAQSIDTTDVSTPVVYSSDQVPAWACLTQRVLGFAYDAPVEGVLTSGFGYRTDPETEFHSGIDLAADEGTKIRAFADGTVCVVGESSELGRYVKINHENGISTLYAHCKKVTAADGQTVRRGDAIATVGQTGHATGPHLHFELICGATYLNPVYYV
jgi:murein DD-endopeptidase MepM/ murein hydrolase activator NlpD